MIKEFESKTQGIYKKLDEEKCKSDELIEFIEYLTKALKEKTLATDITRDDIEWFNVYAFLLKKIESRERGEDYNIREDEWKNIGADFGKLKFIVDELEAIRAIEQVRWSTDCRAYLTILDSREFKRLIFRKGIHRIKDLGISPKNVSATQFNVTEKTLQKIDIFISSPSDVDEERKIASEVIEQLNLSPYIADRCKLKPLAYERIVPAAVGKTPQRTVDHYMMQADQADIFICILWSRMGTPVIDSEGKEYQSGTEYEFTTAYKANQESEKPYILLYRGMKSIPIDADLRQVELVKAFFESFKGKEADLKGFYKKYRSNVEFEKILRHDLEMVISKIIPPARAAYKISKDSDIKMKAKTDSQIHEKLAKMYEHLKDTKSTLLNMDETGLVWSLKEIRMLNNDFSSVYDLKDYTSDENKKELIKDYIIPILENLYSIKKKYEKNPHHFEKDEIYHIWPNEWEEWKKILIKIAITSLEYNIETEKINNIIDN